MNDSRLKNCYDSSMELRVLKYFLEAARLGNITKAAENLNVTQPTMSRQIKDLEYELGEKLFERTNYAIRLTPAGELLRERAEDILSMADKTMQDFKSLKDDEISGDIAIACAESRNISFPYPYPRSAGEILQLSSADVPSIDIRICPTGFSPSIRIYCT